MNINKTSDKELNLFDSNTETSKSFPPISSVDEKIASISKKSIPLKEEPVKQETTGHFFSRKFKVLKQEISFAVKVFLSLFSREKNILLDLSLVFKKDAFHQIRRHEYLTSRHPNKEKMLNTLEEIVNFSMHQGNRKQLPFFREVKVEDAVLKQKTPCFDWYIDDKKQVFILDKEKNRAFCLNTGQLSLFQIENKSVKIITEEMIIPCFKLLSIDENHVNRFLNLMCSHKDVNKDMVQNTLRDIVRYLINRSGKNPYTANLKRDHSYGWSINPGDKILIRTGIAIGSGVTKKVTQSFCLNDGKIYANLALNKKIFKNIPKNEKKDFEREYLSQLNRLMEKSHENIVFLKKLNIPHIPSVPVSGYTKTQLGTKKLISTQELFQCDGETLTHQASEVDHQAFIEKHKANIYFAMREVSETLKELHRHKLVHGDVKPLNIGLNFDESNEHLREALLIDWDDMTQEGEEFLGGTKIYLAPERRGGNIMSSSAKDAYALGVSFAQLLFGEEFLPADQFEKIQINTVDEHLNGLNLKEEEREKVRLILKGLLENDPNKRMNCADAHELFKELTQG